MIKSINNLKNISKDNDILKTAVGIIAGFSADMTISALIKYLLPKVGGWKKAAFAIGTFVIAMKIGEDCEAYVNKVWDETATTLNEAKTELKKAEEEEAEAEQNDAGE